MDPSPKPTPTKRSLMSSLMQAAPSSFKEDSYLLSTLKANEQNSLKALKTLLNSSHTPISLWGVNLLDETDERADVLLLKFLRARDFNPAHAHAMLLKCAKWREEFNADGVLEEELGFKELEGVVAYMHGWDKEGHPVCYNSYGLFKEKNMFDKFFGDGEKLKKFLRWRVQVMERGVRLLQFTPGGVNSIVQVTDLKDMPKGELRAALKQVLFLFQDNYPEMVARKVFVNVPWYFSVLYSVVSPFLTERTKSKFLIAKEGNVAETLYKFIRPEFVPVQYGGLSRAGDLKNGGPPKPASEFIIKGEEKVNLEIDGIESGATITWDIVVGGWDIDYSAEYVPSAEGSYIISVEKTRKIPSSFEEPVHNVFTAKEAGKMVICIDNTSSRRRKAAAYRYSVRKSSSV